MEREFGSEITKTFGARLKRIYQLDEAALPGQMVMWLERLKHAEAELAESPRHSHQSSSEGCSGG